VREALAALVTLVGLLPGVQARVLDQVVLVFKRFLANLTLVWSFSCEEGEEDTRGLQRQGWGLLRPSLPLRSLRCWSHSTPEPPHCLFCRGSSVAATKQKKTPTFILQLRLWMLLIVVILLKQLRIIKKMTQRASMENWQL